MFAKSGKWFFYSIPLLAIPLFATSATKATKGKNYDLAHQKAPPAQLEPKSDSGCLALLQAHCKELYKPAKEPTDPKPGNRTYKVGDKEVVLRRGTDEHGISQSLRRLLEQRIKTKDSLPPKFRAALEEVHYFEDLEKVLKEASLVPNSIENVLRFNSLAATAGEKFSNSMAITVAKAVSPDYYTKENPPVEEVAKADELSEELEKEITKVLWADTPEWKNVESQFNEVQQEFAEYLKQRKTLSPAVKQAWIDKIRSVTLVLPDNDEGSNCAGTLDNASYNPELNTFTVCAGLFTTADDVRFAIAHELAHSVDPQTQFIDQERTTDLSRTVIALKKEVCDNAPLTSCPTNFKKLQKKETLAKFLGQLHAPSRAPETYYACLRYNKSLKPANSDSLNAYATGMERDLRAEWADSDLYLDLTKEETINETGRREKNYFYMNPCGRKKMKEKEVEVDTEGALFFVSAYLCSKQKNPVKRLDEAEQASKGIVQAIYQRNMQIQGTHSYYANMVKNGHSELVGERFGDALASGVYSRILEKNHKDLADRRQQAWCGFSNFCLKPSLREAYPEEAQWQKKRSFEPHSDGQERMIEFFREDLRNSLGCDKDFKREECRL
jgi:hypothetical protein